MPAQLTLAAYVAAQPTPPRLFRLPLIRHARWLIAVLAQDARCQAWRKRAGGVPDIEFMETALIDAIWDGLK